MDAFYGKPVIATNRTQTSPSWLTTVRPDYYFARSETLFATPHMKTKLFESYVGHNQPSHSDIALERPSELAFPNIYHPPPVAIDPLLARLTPASGNQMRVMDTYDPQEVTGAESLASQQTETWRNGLDQLELLRLNRYEKAERQRRMADRAADYTSAQKVPYLNTGIRTDINKQHPLFT